MEDNCMVDKQAQSGGERSRHRIRESKVLEEELSEQKQKGKHAKLSWADFISHMAVALEAIVLFRAAILRGKLCSAIEVRGQLGAWGSCLPAGYDIAVTIHL